MKNTRREFLKTSGLALLGASVPGIWNAPIYANPKEKELPPTLISIYLRGGADPLNVLVPFGDPLYYQVRPSIAVPVANTPEEAAVLKINNYFGMHPSMKPIYDLYQTGIVAPILNVGSPHSTRSHFDAQDFMERAAPGLRSVTEGWLNRYLEMSKKPEDSKLRGIALQSLLPRSLRGEYPVLAYANETPERTFDSFNQFYGACNDSQMLKELVGEDPSMKEAENPTQNEIITSGSDTSKRIEELRKIVSDTNQSAYPKTEFGRKMANLSQIIKAEQGLEVAALDYRGWDHHSYEGGSSGQLSKMLQDLSSSIAALVQDLGTRMDRVLILVMSEFGRTIHENGNNGTDHGHGGFMLALGGMVNGKKIHGKWTGLEPTQLYENRDLPVHTDFRMVFAEVLFKLFEFDAFKKPFFPDYKPTSQPLNFLQKLR